MWEKKDSEMTMWEILLLLFGGCYTFLLLFLIIVSILYPKKDFKNREEKNNTLLQNVSIVIPFKNESKNLPYLLNSLDTLEFPALFEVIFIDDGSSDNSVETISEWHLKSNLKIKILQNTYNPNRNLTSKQQAIDLGIKEAAYPLIALTDADIILDKKWLISLVISLRKDVELVFGHTVIKTDGSFFSFLQAFQLEFLFAFASVFSYCGITGSCMGNNLLIRKESYFSSGGFNAIGYTVTEDRALLCHFKRQKRKISTTIPFLPTAYTFSHKKLSDFIIQVYRWAKGGFTYGKNLFFLGIFFAIQNLIFLLTIVNIIPSTHIKSITIINFFLLWLFLVITFVKNGIRTMFLYFPLYYIFLLVESIILAFFLLSNKKVVWKGRKF
ncbi:MAG: glycosyltransferase [Chitinispirillaceae bacterium]|nr:glycosyltransferase [Chitinispirillaceae bacterium]